MYCRELRREKLIESKASILLDASYARQGMLAPIGTMCRPYYFREYFSHDLVVRTFCLRRWWGVNVLCSHIRRSIPVQTPSSSQRPQDAVTPEGFTYVMVPMGIGVP